SQCAGYAVLHQDLRGIEIGADVEGDGERIAAVAGAGRLHINHVLDAIDLLFNRQGNGVHKRPRAGAGIPRGHLHRRWHYVGILRDRQTIKRDRADNDHQNGDDVGENRPLDEELGNHFSDTLIGCRARLGVHFLARDRSHDATDDHAVVLAKPAFDHAEIADHLAGVDLTLLDDVVLVHYEHVRAALIATKRDVRDKQHRLSLPRGDSYAHEVTG